MTSSHNRGSARIAASPRARRAMRQRGINPRLVNGSGPHGRITEVDVLRDAVATGLSPMRRSIARVTTASALIPQFQLRAELDATLLMATRLQWLARVQAEEGVRLSITDLLLRAMALALHDFPAANAVWHDNTIHALSEANVSLVVDLHAGLLIPALRRIDQLSLAALARERSQCVEAARRGRVPADSGQGVATGLSNLGSTRVDDFAAVLFPPQSTILSVGRIAPRPFVVDGELSARPTLRLTLTVDHRALDGVPAAQYLGQIVRYLEQPSLMLATASAGVTQELRA